MKALLSRTVLPSCSSFAIRPRTVAMSTRVTRSKRPRDPIDVVANYDGDEHKLQPEKKSKKSVEPEVAGQADSKRDTALVTCCKGKAKKVKEEIKKEVETNAVLTSRDDAVSLELPSNLRSKENTSGRWLMKSEPDAFSLDNLFSQYEEKGPAEWDGIRNHVAKVGRFCSSCPNLRQKVLSSLVF